MGNSLRSLEIGGGWVQGQDPFVLHLPEKAKGYADAQVDDYGGMSRRSFPWRPPLEMELEARATPRNPRGTFGFGFWNDPFGVSLGGSGGGQKLPALPNALWFFYGSEPNALPLDAHSSSAGWYASSLRSRPLAPLLVTPAAAAAFVLSRIPPARRWAVRRTYRTFQVEGTRVPYSHEDWYRYRLRWESGEARFWVNDELILRAENPPAGPLGFVAWIDNQYAILSIERGIQFGVLPLEEPQTLQLRGVQIDREPQTTS